MLYRCGIAGNAAALTQACQTARACPIAGFCPVKSVRDVEPQNKAGFPPLTLIIKKKKEQKACCLLIAPLCRPCRVGSKADCRLLTVVATAIFQTAICNWLINAAWVQTVMLIKLRRGFRKQYWWVLQGARRGWTWMSFPSRNSENKQTSKV